MKLHADDGNYSGMVKICPPWLHGLPPVEPPEFPPPLGVISLPLESANTWNHSYKGMAQKVCTPIYYR